MAGLSFGGSTTVSLTGATTVADNGFVTNPVTTNAADGSAVNIGFGRQGDLLVSEVHGKWYTMGYRGATFIGSTAGAGITIPGLLATAAKFVLYNPAGSGKNLELIGFGVGVAGTTAAVIGSLQFSACAGVGVVVAIPTTLTNGILTANPVGATGGAATGTPGSGAAVAKVYAAATIVAPFSFMNLGISFGTTGAAPGPVTNWLWFDGSIILAPGTLISLESSAIQTQPYHPSIMWTETSI